MKNRYLFIPLGLILLLGVLNVLPFNIENLSKRSYQPRNDEKINRFSADGAIDYLTSIRANQITKTISAKDVAKAQEKTMQLSSHKSGEGSWVFRGPDNFGGRTRAILFDNENADLMFAGGVSGGLWKSTTKGQYWEQVTYNGANADDFANLAIVTIAQASNGDIYFGTGEALTTGYNHGSNIMTPLTRGAGIWKSTDRGQTFSRLESTWSGDMEDFAYVNKIGIDITNDKVYAATGSGLKVSSNGGNSWVNANLEMSEYDTLFASDVKVANNGNVIASIGNRCFTKKVGTSQFKYKSGFDEYTADTINGGTGHLITDENVGRLEFSFSKQNPDIVVCAAATTNGGLRNVYRSTDGGDHWVIIGAGGSELFQPFGHQGIYDMCIEISAQSDDEIFIAGLDVWFGKAANTGSLFAWSQVSLYQLNPISTLYVHADQHTIVFDPSDPKTFFVGSDGGISRCYLDKDGIKYTFKTMNKNYNVTQFYSVAMNNKGQLLGGTQDNGNILIYNDPDFPNKGRLIYNNSGVQGDGGHTVMSSIMPTLAFKTLQYGGVFRNNDAEFGDWNEFYSAKIINLNWAEASSYQIDRYPREASFVTPIAYYETDYDENSRDTVEFIAKKTYLKGETYRLPSHNIYKAPIYVTMEDTVYEDDTIRYWDHYGSLFALGMARTLWITRSATNWSKTALTDVDWFRAVKRGVLDYTTDPDNMECVTQMAFSSDGSMLFFSTSYNKFYRLSGLDTARTVEDVCYFDGDPITKLTQIGTFENRTITGIACDPNNINNLIVTIGNYGNEDYVYYCDSASVVGKSFDKSNFKDVTGNIPLAPAYCALFEISTEGTVLVGTDMGVFKSSDITAENVEWETYQDELGPVPTFQIKQQTQNWRWTDNYGMIYIGTHGRGLFENSTYLSDIEDNENYGHALVNEIKANVYPNPVVDELTVNFELESNNKVNLYLMNVSGQVLSQEIFEGSVGTNNFTLNTSDLNAGMYLIRIVSNGAEVTKQIIKK